MFVYVCLKIPADNLRKVVSIGVATSLMQVPIAQSFEILALVEECSVFCSGGAGVTIAGALASLAVRPATRQSGSRKIGMIITIATQRWVKEVAYLQM